MIAVVISDTHIRAGTKRRLPDDVYAALERADAVLHAGDIVEAPLIRELEGFAPVYAVLGNNDDGELAGMLPERRVETLGGVRVAMVHDSGPATGRPGRLRRWFPDADVVVFGHSHIPMNERSDAGQLLFNPGSPTERRRQPIHTFGLLTLDAGEVVDSAIVEVVSPPEG